jgi:hypothetical protein
VGSLFALPHLDARGFSSYMFAMTTIDVRAEKKARQAEEASKAMAEYRAEQAAVDANTLRLRALRLAREAELAANPPPPEPKRKKAKAKA